MAGGYYPVVICVPGLLNSDSSVQPGNASAAYGKVQFSSGWGTVCYDPVNKQNGLAVVKSVYLLDAPPDTSSGTQTPTPQNWQELGNMSIQDAQVISGYIGLLWAGVWGFKQVAKAFSISERNHDE